MEERYLLAAVRYIELNPVRARFVEEPWEYSWSSARAHLTKKDDKLVTVAPLLKIVTDWRGFILSGISEREMEELRKHERTGKPLGSERFLGKLENALGRTLHRQKPGRKKKQKK